MEKLKLMLMYIQDPVGYSVFFTALLLGFIAGGLIMKYQKCRNHGYTFFGDHPIVDFEVPDEKLLCGIRFGVLAGYWTATGEEKEYEKIVEDYLAKIDKLEQTDESIHS